MTMKRGILCEVIFKDAKTGTPTNLIGRIDEYHLDKFNTNVNEFLSLISWFCKKSEKPSKRCF